MSNTKSTVNTADTKALVVTLVNLGQRVEDIFNQGDESEILMLGKFLNIVDKEFGKLVNTHDKLVDKIHDGSKGKNYLPNVKRIHLPRGRKAGVKVTQEVSLVDKIFG